MLRRVTSVLRVIGVLLCYCIARVVPSLGVSRLVNSLGSPDEDVRTVAYMALVKLGAKHTSRLIAIARAGKQTAGVLQILGDTAGEESVPELEIFAASAEEKTAVAAKDAIEAIRLRGNDSG